MAKRVMSGKRRAALLRDIFNAEHDVVGLAEAHGLTPERLATWAGESDNQACLAGLCVLADYQTQLLLSRYRLLAANRLIRLATQEEEGTGADVARRACVDLLKLDLKRAMEHTSGSAGDEGEETGEEDVTALRAALFEGVVD
ncbi:MAG: hypothetical protein WD534_03545 [Phycisphaeraceae bacterium]